MLYACGIALSAGKPGVNLDWVPDVAKESDKALNSDEIPSLKRAMEAAKEEARTQKRTKATTIQQAIKPAMEETLYFYHEQARTPVTLFVEGFPLVASRKTLSLDNFFI